MPIHDASGPHWMMIQVIMMITARAQAMPGSSHQKTSIPVTSFTLRVRGFSRVSVLKPQYRQTTASSLSMALAHSGQRADRSSNVIPYGLASSSSALPPFFGSGFFGSGFFGSGFFGGGFFAAGFFFGSSSSTSISSISSMSSTSTRATKVLPQPLHLIFLPSASAGAFISLSHSGQMTVIVAGMGRLVQEWWGLVSIQDMPEAVGTQAGGVASA